MKTNWIISANRLIHNVGFALQKRSPEILVAAGVIGTVASTVLACKATLKAPDILEEAKETIDAVHKAAELDGQPKAGSSENIVYDENDQTRDLTIIYSKTGLKLLKIYAPSLILGTLSIIGIVQSHRIMSKRNVALGAAYAAMDRAFKDYRKRVRQQFGKDAEDEICCNLKASEILEHPDNPDTTVKVVDVMDKDGVLGSPYMRIFDSDNPNWSKDASMNLYFLRCQQAQLNDILKSHGHLFLNEVYDALNFPRTKAGAVVGWVYDPRHPSGDNYVDFGINIRSDAVHELMTGTNPPVHNGFLLDFNVDGVILDQIASHQVIF